MDAKINNVIYMELYSGPKMMDDEYLKSNIARSIDRDTAVHKKRSHNVNIVEPIYLCLQGMSVCIMTQKITSLLVVLSQGPLLNRTCLFQFCDARTLCEAGYGCSCSSSCSCCCDNGYGCGSLSFFTFPFSSLSHD
jgi:hypothetical protein